MPGVLPQKIDYEIPKSLASNSITKTRRIFSQVKHQISLIIFKFQFHMVDRVMTPKSLGKINFLISGKLHFHTRSV